MDHQFIPDFRTFIQPYLQDIENNCFPGFSDKTKVLFLQMSELVHNLIFLERPRQHPDLELNYIPEEPIIIIGTNPTSRFVTYKVNYQVGNFDSTLFRNNDVFDAPQKDRTLSICWNVLQNKIRVEERINITLGVSFWYVPPPQEVWGRDAYTNKIDMVLSLLDIFIRIFQENKTIQDIENEFKIKKTLFEQQYNDQLRAYDAWKLNFDEFQKAAQLGKLKSFSEHPGRNVWNNSALLDNIYQSGHLRPSLLKANPF